MKHNARIWVHCTSADCGDQWKARRMAPIYRGANEPDTPRLCVSPTVCSCLAAHPFSGAVYVYLTKPLRGITPKDVWDAPITREHWLIPPVTLTKVATIPEDVVFNCVEAAREQVICDGMGSMMARMLSLRDTILTFDELYQTTEIGVSWVSKNDRKAYSILEKYLERKAKTVVQ